MKKIGIDFTYIKDNSVTGVRKHGEEILNGLIKANADYEIVLFVEESLKESFESKYPNYKIVPMKYWFKNIKYVRRINMTKIGTEIKAKKMERENCDILIYPYTYKLTPLIKKQEKIISILDLIPLDEIKDKESRIYNKIKKQNIKIMNQSKYIVTISEYSKKRLQEINPDYKGEIFVIPSPVEKPKKTNKKVSDIINKDIPYIFSINSFFKNKNQITLVKAFNRIKDEISHSLILVGRPELESGKSGYNEIIDYIEKNNLQERVLVLSHISDEDRNTLFYNTDLFVTTSLMEGFGRTPVEAALCTVPVISTKTTSLPEATMNEVFYYENAIDDEELARKMLEVLNNKPSKERLDEISRKLEKEYSEQRITGMYIKLINHILKGEENAKDKTIN